MISPPPPDDINGVTIHGAPLSWRTPVAIAVVIGLVSGWLLYASAQTPPLDGPVPTTIFPQHEDRLIQLEREAIDNAYRQHVTNLYMTWMKDLTGQPARALKGINIAKEAYVRSMEAIEAREKKTQEMITRPPGWRPP